MIPNRYKGINGFKNLVTDAFIGLIIYIMIQITYPMYLDKVCKEVDEKNALKEKMRIEAIERSNPYK